MILHRITLAALALPCIAAVAAPHPTPDIRTDDVERFFAVYDAAHGKPTAEQVQQQYLDRGSDGLHTFAKARKLTGESIAQAIATRPEIFANARRCADVLPAVKRRLGADLAKLVRLYPQAIVPAVTIAVGRGRTGGTADASGVRIGLEALCSYDFLNPDLTERFVHVIAHEYVHVQQPMAQTEEPDVTVLDAALIEGGAELVGELTSGKVGYGQLGAFAKGREPTIERAFVADMDRKAEGSAWLYNGAGTPDHPGDLGYWVGYRITKAYYQQARDKRAAIRDIINIRNGKDFLARSGWQPGMKLD